MKKLIFVFLFCAFTNFLSAQTNVSGGIYTNTTWTLANSPYIVIDTVVVFPGVTLAIEPGVTVRFDDNKFLEIRQSNLIAQGTSTDFITFTSNSSSPVPGSWKQIFLNQPVPQLTFKYCNFRYASRAIWLIPSFLDTITIKNSTFSFNITGMQMHFSGGGFALIDSVKFLHNSVGGELIRGLISNSNFLYDSTGLNGYFCSVKNSIIRNNYYDGLNGCDSVVNCIINNNNRGVIAGVIKNCIVDSNMVGIPAAGIISNCEIKHNVYGVEAADTIKYNIIENDSIGIYMDLNGQCCPKVYCNKICDNTAYSLFNGSHFNFSIANNFWCTNDSATIANAVYDGYDNIAMGLVNYMSIDTQQCYLNTGTSIYILKDFSSISISPNPATSEIKITNLSPTENQISIFNILGQQVKSIGVSHVQSTILPVSDLPAGIYVVTIFDGEKIVCKKFVKE